MVCWTKECACATCSRCLRCCPRPRGQYVDGRAPQHRCRRHPGAAVMQLCGCATPLPGAVAQPHSSQILPTACHEPVVRSPSVAGTCETWEAAWAVLQLRGQVEVQENTIPSEKSEKYLMLAQSRTRSCRLDASTLNLLSKEVGHVRSCLIDGGFRRCTRRNLV